MVALLLRLRRLFVITIVRRALMPPLWIQDSAIAPVRIVTRRLRLSNSPRFIAVARWPPIL
jgi:hypothetical protein